MFKALVKDALTSSYLGNVFIRGFSSKKNTYVLPQVAAAMSVIPLSCSVPISVCENIMTTPTIFCCFFKIWFLTWHLQITLVINILKLPRELRMPVAFRVGLDSLTLLALRVKWSFWVFKRKVLELGYRESFVFFVNLLECFWTY